MHQRAGNRHTLLLAARQLARKFIRLIGDVEFFKQHPTPFDGFSPLHAVGDQRDCRVFRRGQRGDEIILLKDKADG